MDISGMLMSLHNIIEDLPFSLDHSGIVQSCYQMVCLRST